MTSGKESYQDGPSTLPISDDGWWARERAQMINGRVAELSRPGDRLLDVGCGRGSMLADPRLADRVVVRMDSHMWDEWDGSDGFFVCASATALPFRSNAFDLVGSFDLIEHLDDDVGALREQRRVVRDSGMVVIAVPSDQRLWSALDDAVGHRRRYDRKTLIRSASAAGLQTDRTTAFFSFLWLPALAIRRSRLRSTEPGNSESIAARFLRTVISVLAAAERWAVRRFRIPMGTSMWAECRPNRRQ